MTRQVMSRTQRRMEKRQALMVLVLLLLTALVSFSLGVMVGKGGDSDGVVEEQIAAGKPAPAGSAVSEPGQAVVAQKEGSVESELTFYDTLPQGQDNALGSGINLPPEPQKTGEPVPEEIASAVPVKKSPPAPKPALAREETPQPAAVAAEPPAQKPAATAVGDYLVQVASVKERQGAMTLRNRMVTKGYAAFVEQVDLGAKGIWHRVYAGPFSTRQDADRAVAALKADRIASAPLVKRR